MSSSTNIPGSIKRKVLAAGLLGLAFPVLLAIFFTPSSRARMILLVIAVCATLISWFLLRKRT